MYDGWADPEVEWRWQKWKRSTYIRWHTNKKTPIQNKYDRLSRFTGNLHKTQFYNLAMYVQRFSHFSSASPFIDGWCTSTVWLWVCSHRMSHFNHPRLHFNEHIKRWGNFRTEGRQSMIWAEFQTKPKRMRLANFIIIHIGKVSSACVCVCA